MHKAAWFLHPVAAIYRIYQRASPGRASVPCNSIRTTCPLREHGPPLGPYFARIKVRPMGEGGGGLLRHLTFLFLVFVLSI